LEPEVERTLNSIELDIPYLKKREEVEKDKEFVELWKRNSNLIEGKVDRDSIMEIESENLVDYLKLLELRAEDKMKSVERAAYLFPGGDLYPAKSTSMEWFYLDIDPDYTRSESVHYTFQDARETAFSDEVFDLVMIKAPGTHLMGCEEEVLSETYRVLDKKGILAVSDAYIREAEAFESPEPLRPSPAVFSSKLEYAGREVRNFEGELFLYEKIH